MSDIAYAHDRIPVIPPSLFPGDRILTVHTEGQPVGDVNWLVIERDEAGPGGEVTVVCEDGEGVRETQTFSDPQQWLSVAFPRHRLFGSAA